MKQQEVFKKIGGILKELNEQYAYLQTAEEPLNDLELELFLANSHFLTDHLLILSKLNSQTKTVTKSAEKPEQLHEEKYFEPLVQPFTSTGKHVHETSHTTDNSFELNPENDKPVPQINLESSAGDSYSFIPAATQPVKEGHKPEVLTINEKMSAQLAEKSGGATIQAISDLKPAINLNDKLLFIKDLFNGYSLAYSEAIEILNRFNTFDEADLFLKKNYVTKNNWESKPETTAKLYELLKRRYA